MSNGTIGVACGSGTAATALAFGRAVEALTEQKHVIVIRFLSGARTSHDWSLMKRLEPELKLFRFEQSMGEKEEAHLSIINGLNFAKKVMATGECDLLILDGILKLLEQEVVSVAEFKQILASQCGAELILTGARVPAGLENCVHSIEQIEQVHIDKAV